MAKYKVKTRDCQLIVGVRLSLKEKINVTQLDFFSNRYIRGLLKVKMIKKSHIEYYGPIGISLYERLKKPISKYDFLFIMEQVVDTVQKLNANSLIINNVIFDIKNVFINEITKELQFIYLPLENVQKETDIIGFMEQIIYASKPQQENDMEYVSRYVYFVKSLTKFDANKIEKYIQNEDRSVVNTIKRRNVGQSGYITDKPADYYNHYSNRDNVVIGKKQEWVDLVIPFNRMISRKHCRITNQTGIYYINDEGSANGTFVNGVRLNPGQKVQINRGDIIRMADSDFQII